MVIAIILVLILVFLLARGGGTSLSAGFALLVMSEFLLRAIVNIARRGSEVVDRLGEMGPEPVEAMSAGEFVEGALSVGIERVGCRFVGWESRCVCGSTSWVGGARAF